MLNSITLTDQRSVLVERRCSADCSSAERSRSALSGRAVALPRNLIAVPRAGFTTARVRRYHSSLLLSARQEKGRRDLAARRHSTAGSGKWQGKLESSS